MVSRERSRAVASWWATHVHGRSAPYPVPVRWTSSFADGLQPSAVAPPSERFARRQGPPGLVLQFELARKLYSLQSEFVMYVPLAVMPATRFRSRLTRHSMFDDLLPQRSTSTRDFPCAVLSLRSCIPDYERMLSSDGLGSD